MKNDLIKRYIYAVTCNLPTNLQAEVEMELENMISELIDARCGETEPTDQNIRIVLTELGSPEELAVKYSGEEHKALISGIYFLWFKRILKIVLPIAAGGVALAVFISSFIGLQSYNVNDPTLISQLISEVISGAVSAAMQAFVWIVVIFAILEHKKVKLNEGDFLSKLPPVPDKRAQIKIHQPIINIFWHIALATLLLGFSYLIGGYTESTGWVPAFNQSYIQEVWYYIISWVIIGIAYEIYRLTERHYSKKLAIATVVSNTLTGVLATLFFTNDKIVNPNFNVIFDAMFQLNSERLGHTLPAYNLIMLAIILFALLLNIAVTTLRAFRYDK
ncbi:MAG: hypothetical protein E7L17_00745 [Clostridium sp.]|uniref:hypothetical protein n=1 Tax=Clostridium sp. TaxID=1506 RepID=UPI0029085FB3|nr:hypothetical protein [Clostridium sp.]MDU7336624.1 hypothetical protein [Clostridium sp.]